MAAFSDIETGAWSTTSGIPVANIDTTSCPARDIVETTGGSYAPSTVAPIVSAEEKEWRILLTSERKSARKRRITDKKVIGAIRERRNGK